MLWSWTWHDFGVCTLLSNSSTVPHYGASADPPSRVLSLWIQMFLIQRCSPEDILLRREALGDPCGNMATGRKKEDGARGRFLASQLGPDPVPLSSLLCLMPQVSWPWGSRAWCPRRPPPTSPPSSWAGAHRSPHPPTEACKPLY